MKQGVACRARKQPPRNGASPAVAVVKSRPSQQQQREARSPDPLPSARSGCATSSSTTSSLAGTKQWVDDVLSASLKRQDASHQAFPQELSRGSTASGASSIAFFNDKTSTDRTAEASVDRLVPPDEALATTGTSSSSSEASSSASSWDVHSHACGRGPSDPKTTASLPPPAASQNHHHRTAYSQRTLRIDELLSLYKLLDADDDGVLSATDLSAFLALHPQSIDLTVQHFFHARKSSGGTYAAAGGVGQKPVVGLSTAASGATTDDAIPIVVALSGGDVQMLASCPRSQIRDPVLHQRYAKRRFKVHNIPQAKEVEGSLWWALGRARVEERAVKFTSFVFHLVGSLSAQAASSSSAAGASDTRADHKQHRHDAPPAAASGGSVGAVTPFISFFHFQLLYYEAVRLLRSDEQSYVLAVLDVPMLQQLMWFFEFLDIFGRASGRWWAASVDEDEALAKPPSHHTDGRATKGQVYEALSLLDVETAARKFVTRMSPDGSEPHQQRLPIAPPLGTCLPAVYWTFAAWDLPRSWLDVSLLQRLGEVYLKRKASQHAKLTYQFLRHLWLSQRHHVDRSGTWGAMQEQRDTTRAAASGGGDGVTAEQQQPPWLSGAPRSISSRGIAATTAAATTSSGRRLPSSVAEQIALVQLSNRFLAFHGIHRGGLSSTSASSLSSSASLISSSSEAGGSFVDAAATHSRQRRSTSPAVDTEGGSTTPTGAMSLADRVAKKGVAALWETESGASTQASPKRPLVRRNTWRLTTGQQREEARRGGPNDGSIADGNTAVTDTEATTTAVRGTARQHAQPLRSEFDASPELLVDAVVRQSLLSQDLTLHAVLRPDALSLIPSLCERERHWMRRATMWCVVRSAMYALAAAVLIGLADLAAQMWILGSSPSFLDTSDAFSSFKELFSFGDPSVGETATVQGNATATGSSSSSNSGSSVLDDVVGASSTSMSTFIKYQVMVLLATLLVSLGEVVFLYLDTLQLCLQLARCGGIPLDAGQSHASSSAGDASVVAFIGSMSMGSIFSAGGGSGTSGGGAVSGASGSSGDNGELRLIRQHLLKRRVRFIIAAITKCALQIRFDSTTVLGIDVRNRNVSRLAIALLGLFERLKRVAPSIFVRVVAARVLSRSLVPFVSAPLLLAWNCVLTRSSVDAARLVVLGAISMERIVPDLLSRTFSAPPRVVARNEGLMGGAKATRRRGPTGGGGVGIDSPIHVYASRPLYYVPFHVARELLMLILFYAHAIDDAKVVHPSIHCLLVELLSCCEMPDVCMCMVPKDRGNKWHHRNAERTTKQPATHTTAVGSPHRGAGGVQPRSMSMAPSCCNDIHAKGGDPAAAAAGDGGGATSYALDASASTVAWSAHLDTMLLDVSGGNGTALSAWLRSFVRELNAMRSACGAVSPTAAWLQRYTDACPWPVEVAERAHLAQHIRWTAVSTPAKVCDARIDFLMENAFPAWASLAAMGPCPLHTIAVDAKEHRAPQSQVVGEHVYERDDGATSGDEETASNCSVEMGHTSAHDALRSGTSIAPFQASHVKLFLAMGIVMCAATTTGSGLRPRGTSRIISEDPKKRRFLLLLRRAYLSSVANRLGGSSHAQPSHATNDVEREKLIAAQCTERFLSKVDALHSMYWAGSPALNVSEIMYLIDESCKGAW